MKTLQRSDRAGFTLIDLMVILIVMALLLVVCIPAFARAGMNSKGLRCFYNVRQLATAWRMYADDNRDRMVYASTEGGVSAQVNGDPYDPNNYAWSGTYMDYTPGNGNQANWDVNYDIKKRPLWPYVGRDASVYKCPEDQSAVQNASGTMVPRVQSMAVNLYLGGFAGTGGGWDSSAPYPRFFFKTTELTAITPAKAFVFADQRPDHIIWSNFMVDMRGFFPPNPSQHRFRDLPGFFHDGGAAFSFADGHGELHRWQDMRTVPPFSPGALIPNIIASPNNPDVDWLQDHATRTR